MHPNKGVGLRGGDSRSGADRGPRSRGRLHPIRARASIASPLMPSVLAESVTGPSPCRRCKAEGLHRCIHGPLSRWLTGRASCRRTAADEARVLLMGDERGYYCGERYLLDAEQGK